LELYPYIARASSFPLHPALTASWRPRRRETRPPADFTGTPVEPGRPAPGPGEHSDEVTIACGDIGILPLPEGASGTLTIEAARGFDLGQGRGRSASIPVKGGVVGIIGDARGRPLMWAATAAARREQVRRWQAALDCYPA